MKLLASLITLGAFLPMAALARNPDFERDAKPILAHQPGLIRYVHSHFVVQETGIARLEGQGMDPQPPFIFSARPRGQAGPYYLRLLIEPGPAGRILKVADVRALPPGAPILTPAAAASGGTSASAPPAPETAPEPDSHLVGSGTPAPAPSSSSQPTSETPSGPIRN